MRDFSKNSIPFRDLYHVVGQHVAKKTGTNTAVECQRVEAKRQSAVTVLMR